MTSTDPIFAKIEAHRAAVKAYLSAAALAGSLVDDTPEWRAASVVEQTTIEQERAAFIDVLTSDPTTLAGAVALLDHGGQDHFLGEAPDAPYGQAALFTRVDMKGPLAEAIDRFPARLAGTLRDLICEPPASAIDEAESPR
jgi:hypothetical protein